MTLGSQRLLAAAVLAAMVVAAAAAAAASGGQQSLDEKVKVLQDGLYRKPVLHLNMEKWRNLVRSQPRNYSMMVMFTALSPGVNCPICKPAYDEYFILANSYRYAHSEARALYFAVVDYEEAPQIFQQMNLNTAPILYHFGPKLQGKKKPEQMDFQRHGFDAEAMARFISDSSELSDLSIRILRPPNYAAPVIVLLLAMLVLGLLYMRRNNLEFLYNRTFWASVCVAICFIFMSGQMWNHIRGPPFFMTNPNTRETQYIHQSTQYQLVGETYLVAGLYAAITFGFILMNDSAIIESVKDAVKSKKGSLFFNAPQYVMVSAGLFIVAFFFSALLSVFRSKYSGYPYSFLFS